MLPADADGADPAEAGHARVARQAERAETGNRRAAAEQQRPSDRAMRQLQIAAMPAQRELHENAVVHARAENQRQGHEVEQIPCQPQIFITASRQNPLNSKMPRLKKISANRRNASQSESKIRPTMGSSSFQRFFLTAARTVPPSKSQPESQTPSRGNCASSCANEVALR